jgi:uncharacterized membrane protein
MATLSQTVAKLARLVEANVTLPASSSTVEAISLPAGCVVLAAGVVTTTAIAGSTGYTIDLSIGSADVQSALDIQAATVGTITVEAAVPVATAVADTLDVVATVTGTATAGVIRVWALVLDMTTIPAADEVDRDQLA